MRIGGERPASVRHYPGGLSLLTAAADAITADLTLTTDGEGAQSHPRQRCQRTIRLAMGRQEVEKKTQLPPLCLPDEGGNSCSAQVFSPQWRCNHPVNGKNLAAPPHAAERQRDEAGSSQMTGQVGNKLPGWPHTRGCVCVCVFVNVQTEREPDYRGWIIWLD